MKKAITYLIFAMLIMATFVFAVPKGLAEHTAKVEWVKYPGSMQVVLDPQTISTHWPDLYTVFSPTPQAHVTGNQVNPLVFNVTNTGPDTITSIEVFIQQDSAGYSYFYLNETKVTKDLRLPNPTPAAGWVTETIEADPNREIRGFRFRSETGIPAGFSLLFWMYFRGGPEYCTYEFTIITHDNGLPSGLPPKAYDHHLRVVMDNFPPIISAFTPANGATVDGLPLPCGNHYFPIDVKAYDNKTCSSGIAGTVFSISVIDAKKQTIWSRTGIIKNDTGPDYKMYYFSKNDTWIAHFEVRAYDTVNRELPEGYYNISVTVKDRVGNSVTEVHNIKYVPPPIPVFTASPNTWIKDPKTGLVESEQVVYKNKVLGSSVTLTETGFKSGTNVEFRIYIPTYIYYNKTYGTFNVLVNYTKAAADGSATVKFIFPKAPQGTYTVFITGLDPAGTPLTKYKTVAVTCEVIFNPDEIIGPAVINVMATGLLHPETTQPGYQLASLLIREQSWENPKDALMGVNSHISWNWYVDANGTLQTSIAGGTGIKVDPGFSMPILQPGTYEITILIQGTFYRWQCVDWSQPPLTYTSQTNTIKVKDWTGDILNAANAAKTAAEGAKSSADAAKSSADAAKSSADAAKSSADAAKSSADAAKSSADAAKSSADAAKSSADAAKNSADAAKSSADSAATGIDAAKNAAQGLTIPVYLAVIFSLIAAIIAAACAILVYRKIA